MKRNVVLLAAPVAALALVVPLSGTSSAGPKTAACTPTVLSSSSGNVGGPVIQSATVAYDPTNPANAGNAGYYAATTPYPSSGQVRAKVDYTTSVSGVTCGSVSLVVYGVKDGLVVPGALLTRTVQLPGDGGSPVTVDALLDGIPASNQTTSGGACLASQLEVRDSNGALVQKASSTGPQAQCPTGGGGLSYGG